jgi:hypothetical protein
MVASGASASGACGTGAGAESEPDLRNDARRCRADSRSERRRHLETNKVARAAHGVFGGPGERDAHARQRLAVGRAACSSETPAIGSRRATRFAALATETLAAQLD